MLGAARTARLANIRLHPIKGLDPVSVPEARIGANGGLHLDRVWVLFTVEGKWINGKRNPEIHHIRAEYDQRVSSVALRAESESPVGNAVGRGAAITPVRLAFPADLERAAAWFSEYFGCTVIVRYVSEGAPDDGLAPGPTIVSTASLQSVCDLFP